jgi:hypothetical protein
VASIGCLLIVVRKMLERQGLGQALVGLVTIAYAFIWGWNNPRVRVSSFRLRDVMTLWSLTMGAAIVLALILSTEG